MNKPAKAPRIRTLRTQGTAPEGTCPECWGDPDNFRTGDWYIYLDKHRNNTPYRMQPGLEIKWKIPANTTVRLDMHRSDGAYITTNETSYPCKWSIRMKGETCGACGGHGTYMAFARKRITGKA